MTRGDEPGTTNDESEYDTMNALVAKLETMTTDALVDLCCKLAREMGDEAGMVSDSALSILQKRLPSDKFVAFCDELYAAMG